MNLDSDKSISKNLWNKLSGDPGEFSMENRAFNYICIVTFAILVYFLICDVFIAQYLMSFVIVALLFIVSCLYYFSRFKKKYHTPIIIYVVCSYLALILNYYANSGINGPTLCIFFMNFYILIAIGKPKQYPLWISLQIIVIPLLLLSEYLHPEWVPDTYPGKGARFVDIAWTYVAVIVFIFTIINYLRKYYNRERLLAEKRLLAISGQNKLITAQNLLLEKVNDEKDKLFSIVSHDLKSPLDSIIGYLELLADNQLDLAEKTEIEAELLERTKYTSDMLFNLLSWARVQMQGVIVRLTEIHLNELVAGIVDDKIPSAAKKGIKLTCSLDPSIHVIGDSDMLLIVIRNLVNNAIKFTRPGGEVLIKAVAKERNVEISVKDNGIGIPVDKQCDIFSLKTSSTFGTNNEKGIGLGLRMCKEFMNYQNGKIWFESKPGTGSVFYISLPQPMV